MMGWGCHRQHRGGCGGIDEGNRLRGQIHGVGDGKNVSLCRWRGGWAVRQGVRGVGGGLWWIEGGRIGWGLLGKGGGGGGGGLGDGC